MIIGVGSGGEDGQIGNISFVLPGPDPMGWGSAWREKTKFPFVVGPGPLSSNFGGGGFSYSYELYNPENGLSLVQSLRGFRKVGAEVVGVMVSDCWGELVATRKKGGYGWRGHTKDRALEVGEEGRTPQKKQEAQKGALPTGLHRRRPRAPPPPRS